MGILSLCMIVKNEESTLGRCLESVADAVDEIVIVDTGSADRTMEVARRFGARVFEFPWVDDFAAARNFSFAQATGDFLMWLDADDVLAGDERAKLEQVKVPLKAGSIDAVSMLYDTAFDDSGNAISRNRRLRIVRRSFGFTWVGVVHEDLITDRGYSLLDSDIIVTHAKPTSESGPSDRNLRILEKLIAGGKGVRSADILNFARELDMHKQFERAIPYYEQFLSTAEGDLDVQLFALHKLASCYYMTGSPDKEWECAMRSLELDVPRPEFSCRIAERFLARNQFAQAAYWYETALNYRNAVGAWSIVNNAFSTWLPHKQLGLCHYQLGDYGKSLHHNKEAQRLLPEDPDIRTNIATLESLIADAQP